jgi:hypothetical protein
LSGQDVFVNGTDNSMPSMLSIMPNVIEKSERTVIMHGALVGLECSLDRWTNVHREFVQDFRFIAEGTRLVFHLQ